MFFDAAIFDLDDTLYSYRECHHAALHQVLDEIGRDCAIDRVELGRSYDRISSELKSELGNTASSHNRFIYFKQLFFRHGIALGLVSEYNDRYWDLFHAAMRPSDGVIELLELLRANKVRMILLSDFQIEPQFRKLATLGILQYFDDILTSEEIGADKPNSKMFLSALSRLKLSADRVLMIGDSFDKDILGASRCGIQGIWINEKAEPCGDGFAFKGIRDLHSWMVDLNRETRHLKQMSRYCGERFDLTQAAGGNSSVKVGGLMLIKSSGYGLSDIDMKAGYSIVDNARLARDLLDGRAILLDEYLLFSKRKASIESYMHALLGKYTLHLHPLQVNEILTAVDGKARIEALFPEALVIDYVTPGRGIAELLLDRQHKGVIFLMNHGLIITAATADEAITLLESVLQKCADHIGRNYSSHLEVNRLSALLNRVTGQDGLTYLSEDAVIRENFSQLDNIYPTFPDAVVYCGVEVLYLAAIDEQEVLAFMARRGMPKLLVFKNELYIFDASLKKCRETETVLKSVLLLNLTDGARTRLSEVEVNFLNNWEAEKYRKTLAS